MKESVNKTSSFLSNLQAAFGHAPWLEEESVSRRQELDTYMIPTTRDEYWKYTRLNKITNQDYSGQSEVSEIDISAYLTPGLETHKLVFINGIFRPELSDTFSAKGCHIGALSAHKNGTRGMFEKFVNLGWQKELFTDINAAYFSDGAAIRIEKNCSPDKPIKILNILSGKQSVSIPRHVIVLEEGAELDVIERSIGVNAEQGFLNSVNDITLKEGAVLRFNKTQQLKSARVISTDQIKQFGNSQFQMNTITMSGELVRNNVNIKQEGSHCHSELNGLYMARANEHVDNHTLVHHLHPGSTSSELYKGVLNDTSTGVFNGKVIVHRDAQQTNAFQSNANILLTDDATVYSKPELEIYADDVKCSHGSTTGQIDDEALFYLQSRGLSKTSARNLLLYAFAADVLNKVKIKPLKKSILTYLANRYNTDV